MRRLVLLLAVLALSVGLYGCHPHHRGTRYRLFPVLQKKKIPTEYNTGSSTLFTIFLIFHFLLWNAKSCLPFPA